MQTKNKSSQTAVMYSAAWRHTGPGILIALLFVVIASATMLRDQSIANASNIIQKQDIPIEQRLDDLLAGRADTIFYSVRLELPMQQLLDADGDITSNAKSLFMLLARRAKSLSLNLALTTNSTQDVGFAAKIAADMMSDGSLQSEQLRIGVEERRTNGDSVHESFLTVSITMCAANGGEVE